MPVTAEEYKRAIDLFLRQVEQKASWGKNEITLLWKSCFIDTVTSTSETSNGTED